MCLMTCSNCCPDLLYANYKLVKVVLRHCVIGCLKTNVNRSGCFKESCDFKGLNYYIYIICFLLLCINIKPI